MRRRRLRTALIGILIIVVVVVVASSGSGSPTASHGHGATGASSHGAPAHYLTLSTDSIKPKYVQGNAPAIPWPSEGQAAVAVPSAGLLETSAAETPVPIASLTKMMTLYLTLKEYPLTATSVGPNLTMTALDQQGYDDDVVSDASSVEVQKGEVLTERQVLTALVVRSANNLADTVARWDDGSVTSFVGQMNQEARALGMTETHYVDTNGLHEGSVSTARDQLIMAENGLAESGFESIVDQSTVTLPITGTLPNYVTAVGSDGVIGVKSGFTDAAMACVVLAQVKDIDNHPTVILAADTGQEEGLEYAQQEDLDMIQAVASGLQLETVVPAHATVGHISVTGGSKDETVAVETASPLVTFAWPDSNIVVSEKSYEMGRSVKAGTPVGTLEASSAGGTTSIVPLIATGPLRG